MAVPSFRAACSVGPLLLAACAHPRPRELRALPCASGALPPSRSAIAWQPDVGVRTVRGRVLGVDGAAVAGRAVAELAGESVVLHAQPVDSGGRFEFEGVAPGRYAIELRSAGYLGVADTVRVTRDSGATVLAVLTRDPSVRAACGLR